MSAGAEILGSAAGTTRHTADRARRIAPDLSVSVTPEIVALARQAFFPSEGAQRQRVLFVSADDQNNASGVAEQVARALASMQKTVSLVERRMEKSDSLPAKKPPMAVRNVEYWTGFQVAENFWRIPSSTLADPRSLRGSGAFGALPFECVVLSCAIGDGMTPVFCGICDGAVLVLTANKTRKEVALRARQILEQLNVKLIGTVLDQRTFPIPEFLYRRL